MCCTLPTLQTSKLIRWGAALLCLKATLNMKFCLRMPTGKHVCESVSLCVCVRARVYELVCVCVSVLLVSASHCYMHILCSRQGVRKTFTEVTVCCSCLPNLIPCRIALTAWFHASPPKPPDTFHAQPSQPPSQRPFSEQQASQQQPHIQQLSSEQQASQQQPHNQVQPTPESERIYVSIAAYRDPECQWTMRDLFKQATHPERVFVGVVWQVCCVCMSCNASQCPERALVGWCGNCSSMS